MRVLAKTVRFARRKKQLLWGIMSGSTNGVFSRRKNLQRIYQCGKVSFLGKISNMTANRLTSLGYPGIFYRALLYLPANNMTCTAFWEPVSLEWSGTVSVRTDQETPYKVLISGFCLGSSLMPCSHLATSFSRRMRPQFSLCSTFVGLNSHLAESDLNILTA